MRRNAPGLPLYASNLMFELVRMLGGSLMASPTTQGHELIRLSCKCDFEPFGRASESWDLVWTLTLCKVRHHTRMTSGWQPTNHPEPMTFKGQDDGECLKKAIQFLKDVPKPAELRERKEPGAIATNALDDDEKTTGTGTTT